MGGAAAEEPEDLFEEPRPGGAGERLAAGDHRVVDVRLDPQVQPGRSRKRVTGSPMVWMVRRSTSRIPPHQSRIWRRSTS